MSLVIIMKYKLLYKHLEDTFKNKFPEDLLIDQYH